MQQHPLMVEVADPARTQPLATYLRRMTLISLLPMSLLATVIAGITLLQFHRDRHIEAQQSAQHLADALNTDLSLRLDGLRTLAALASAGKTAVSLDEWYAAAAAYDKSFDAPVLLSSPEGQMLRHSRRPPGSPLPKLPPPSGRPAFAQALASGQAQVGDPVMGPVLHQKVVPLIVPMGQNALLGLIPAQTLTDTMRRQSLPEGWQAQLLDSTAREIARTADAEPPHGPVRARAALSVAPFEVVIEIESWAYYRPSLVIGGLLATALLLTAGLLTLSSRRAGRGISAAVGQLSQGTGDKISAWPRIAEIENAKRQLQDLRLSERAIAERENFFLQLSDATSPLTDSDEIPHETCRLLAERLQADRACYADIDEDGGWAHVARDAVRGAAPSVVGRYRLSDFAGSLERLRQGQGPLISDVRRIEGLTAQEREACLALQIVSCVGAPVFKAHRLTGALFVTHSQPRQWTDAEQNLIRDVSRRLGASLQRARAEEALSARSIELTAQARKLRWLASELTLAEHKTRELLSKTLHDHLQQILFSTSLTLQRALAKSPGDPILEQARAGLKEAMEAARSLSLEICPPVLRSEGLPSALQWLCTWAQKKYDLPIDLTLDPQADSPALDVRILLFECVRELIFNAVKHAQARRLQVQLQRQSDQSLSITVTDDGRGFDAAQAFNGGSDVLGLGLFSIRERLTLLGGQMRVDSHPGQGARFELQVPPQNPIEGQTAAAAPDPEADDASAPAAASAGPASDEPLRILLADDHALVRQGLRQLIASQPGLEVVAEAVDGAEAVSKTADLHPDVVIMDRSMPVMDGITATRQITSLWPHTRVLGISMDEGKVPLKFERAGAVGFFSKKDGIEPLMERLKQELVRKRGGAPSQS